MKTINFSKTLILLALGMFLISNASAIMVYATWADGTQAAAISYGSSVNFNAYFAAVNPPMTINIKLYDISDSPAGELVYSFESAKVVPTSPYSQIYTIDTSAYVGRDGSFELRLSGVDSVGLTDSWALDLAISDTTAPVITVTGSNPATAEAKATYTDPGASATDNVDGDLTASIVLTGSVNTNLIGTYTLTYTATDSSGNTGTATRTVNVVDTTAPVITITGSNPINVGRGTTYTDAGATATDSYDGNLTASIVLTGVVDTTALGTYTLTYTATDSSGNTGTATRTVNVVDASGPVIVVVSPVNNQEYDEDDFTFRITTDEPVTAWFNVDTGADVTMNNPSGNVYTYDIKVSEGTHTVVFHARDASGNEATATVQFRVDLNGDDDEDEDDENTVTGGDTETNPEDDDYVNQYQPTTIKLVPEEEELSFFQKIILAIINFIKRLFGI